MAKVLIIVMSSRIRNQLRERLEHEGITSENATNDTHAVELCSELPFDVIITENEAGLPSIDIPFIVISEDPTVESVIRALRSGATNYLPAPVDMNLLLTDIRKIVEQAEAPPLAKAPSGKAPSASPARRRTKDVSQPANRIIGESDQIKHLMRLIDKVANNDTRVLITGENGTGKELVARHLHAKSARCGGPFVEVNCAAIPSELIESELFGHEKGAFTSAHKDKKGKFELAHGGTLFMDEIGDMSLSAQAKVLRALQERKIGRVGGDKDIDVDVRIIAATNKDLREEIAKGNFREDLFHRLAVIMINVPPLREHPSDIALLVDHFIGVACDENRMSNKQIHSAAIEELSTRRWSGNIRELRNVVERLVVLSDGDITIDDVHLYC